MHVATQKTDKFFVIRRYIKYIKKNITLLLKDMENTMRLNTTLVKHSVIIASFLALTASTCFADNDVRNQPQNYYLNETEVADSLSLLPPPPAFDSVAFLNDEAQYKKGYQLRKTPRGEQASKDANIGAEDVFKHFSQAFGMKLSKETTPELYKLVSKMREDAGDLATRSAKKHYQRVRPFAFYHTSTCNSKDEKELSSNGSYPSGHTSIGWATALILAEINPNAQNAILKRGFEIGQSRVICGYHWQSDVDAARVVASALVAKLHSNDTFLEQLKKAKEEFKAKTKN